MKANIESQIAAIEAQIGETTLKLSELNKEWNGAIKDAVEPLFKMHGVLEFKNYLQVDGSRLRVVSDSDGRFGNNLIDVHINSRTIAKSFYSTNDSSVFELERMVTIGRVGELILESGDDLLERYYKVYEEYAKKDTILENQRYQLNGQLYKLEQELRDVAVQECIEQLKEGVEFTEYRMPTLKLRFNDHIFLQALKVDEIKGSSATVTMRGYSADRSTQAKIKYRYLEEFAQELVRVKTGTKLATKETFARVV